MISKKIEQRRKFKRLPEPYQLLYMWERWLMYDMERTGLTETREKYIEVCMFISKIMILNNLEARYLPRVTDKNALQVWFDVKSNWDKDSMVVFVSSKKHKISVKRNKYFFEMLDE